MFIYRLGAKIETSLRIGNVKDLMRKNNLAIEWQKLLYEEIVVYNHIFLIYLEI